MRCESASACVVCSARIAKGRGEWLSQIFNKALDRAEVISMLTLTVRHKRGDDLKTLFNAMEASYRNLQGTQAFKDLRTKYNAKFIRVTEITHGRNGYHPHFHIAIISNPLPKVDGNSLWNHYKREITDTWGRWVVNNGLEAPDPEIAVNLVENATNEQRAWYLTKSNGLSSLEVTNGKYKVAKGENISIWGIHSLAVSGDSQALKIWQEYEQAVYKKRIFVVSRGMQEEYGVYMKSDSEMAKDEFSDTLPEIADNLHCEADNLSPIADNQLIFVGAINRETWRRIVKMKLMNDFRNAISENTLDQFLHINELQGSYSYEDIRVRNDLSGELLDSMRQSLNKKDLKTYHEALQALELGELLPVLNKTLLNSF